MDCVIGIHNYSICIKNSWNKHHVKPLGDCAKYCRQNHAFTGIKFVQANTRDNFSPLLVKGLWRWCSWSHCAKRMCWVSVSHRDFAPCYEHHAKLRLPLYSQGFHVRLIFQLEWLCGHSDLLENKRRHSSSSNMQRRRGDVLLANLPNTVSWNASLDILKDDCELNCMFWGDPGEFTKALILPIHWWSGIMVCVHRENAELSTACNRGAHHW